MGKYCVPIVALAMAVVGCGAAAVKPLGEQAKISGSVTIDGKPIPTNSEVTFFNKDQGAALGAKVDSLGKFSLTAADPKVGIPVGRYNVTIRPAVPAAVKPKDVDYAKAMQGGGNAPAQDSSPIPAKFHTRETTTLEFEVKAGPNEFNLDLSKL